MESFQHIFEFNQTDENYDYEGEISHSIDCLHSQTDLLRCVSKPRQSIQHFAYLQMR